MTSISRSRTLLLALSVGLAGCEPNGSSTGRGFDSDAIGDSLKALVHAAYDLSKPEPVKRFMALYPSTGRVVSATAGRITTDRDSLESSIQSFWTGVGQFMVRPDWRWDAMEVDVLSPDAAVMTARYSVPHYTDRGTPHVIGGVWTSVWTRGIEGWRITHEHLSDMPRALAERIEATMPRADTLVSDPHAAHSK
jgi:hypothetical protein